MKKFITNILTAFLLLAAFAVSAQPVKEIYTHPAAFAADEKVDIFFDVTGTQLDGNAGPLYLWTWTPSSPDNGAWDNSAEGMKLVQVKGNIWKYTMTPTTLYNVPKADIKKIEGLLKTKDGSAKTDDFKEDNGNALWLYDFNLMSKQIFAAVPSNYKANRPMSILLNVANALSDGGGEKGQLVGKQPAMHGGVNGWQNVVASDAADKKAWLKDTGNNVWKLDIVPYQYWGLNETDAINEINCVFNNAGDWGASARGDAGGDIVIKPIKPGAVLLVESRFFPKNLTSEDVLSLYYDRAAASDVNLKNIEELYFTAKANGGAFSVEGKAQSLGKGQFKVVMIPSRLFPGTKVTSLEVTFRNADGSAKSKPLTIDGLY